MIVAPPLEVRAESQAAIDPTKGFADLVDRVMPAVISVEVKYANAADREGEAAPREQQFEEVIASEDKLQIKDFLNDQNVSDIADLIYENEEFESQIISHLSLDRAAEIFKILELSTQKRIVKD